jgi:hypothetical protein
MRPASNYGWEIPSDVLRSGNWGAGGWILVVEFKPPFRSSSQWTAQWTALGSDFQRSLSFDRTNLTCAPDVTEKEFWKGMMKGTNQNGGRFPEEKAEEAEGNA